MAAARSPNVVLFVADDLGYRDLGSYGGNSRVSPHLDRMAAQGRRFTDFYVAQASCSASRTAILTGCYPNRLGVLGALTPADCHGIHADESLLPELLRERGYATAILGKWHLGHHPAFLPTRHGFDSYFGLPYSNDMGPATNRGYPSLPVFWNEAVVERDPDQRQLTAWTAARAVRFLEANRDRPFFLYVPFAMPHQPLFASQAFRGKTGHGLYHDVLNEIDDTVGQVLATIDRLGLDRETLVLFTSDNGPAISFGDHAGSTGGLREGKGTTFEGGVRVPLLARWPGHISAGTTSAEPWMNIDLLPTLTRLAGAGRPNRQIDGLDMTPVLLGNKTAHSPHEALAFYWRRELQAVRSGRWKLHFPHTYRALVQSGTGGNGGIYEERTIGLSLYDLASDPTEQTDLAPANPDVVRRIDGMADRFREQLGDSARGTTGLGCRLVGIVEP